MIVLTRFCIMVAMTTMPILSQYAMATTAPCRTGVAFAHNMRIPHIGKSTKRASNSLLPISNNSIERRHKLHRHQLRRPIPVSPLKKSSLHLSNQDFHTSLLSLSDLSPLCLSCIAGGSTCIGAAIVFLVPQDAKGKRHISPEIMCYSLALAGSVMVTVSAISIIPESLLDASGSGLISFQSVQFGQRCLSFGLGCFLYFTLSWFAFPEPDELLGLQSASIHDDTDSIIVPSRTVSQNGTNVSSLLSSTGEAVASVSTAPFAGVSTHNQGTFKLPFALSPSYWTSGGDLETVEQQRAWRVAVLLFISLLFHNFPEGLAVAASAIESDKLGLAVTIGIMLHNIPEGISIAVPCLAARPNQPWLAFALASLSGLAEPMGAFMTLQLLDNGGTATPDMNLMGNVLALVAGIMVTVSLRELFPEAKRQISSRKNTSVFNVGIVSGFLIMSLTEWYLA